MRDELISNNLKLIDFVIFKMNLKEKKDEYYDIGLNALTKAGDTFDESKGNKFSGYACICIKNEILKQIELEKANKRQSNVDTISFNSAIFCDDNNNPITLLLSGYYFAKNLIFWDFSFENVVFIHINLVFSCIIFLLFEAFFEK